MKTSAIFATQWDSCLSAKAVLKGEGGRGGKTFVTPTETNVHGDALCLMVMGPCLLQRLVAGSWRLVVVGSWWLMAFGGWWWLAVGGWWWLAVGGWQGLAVGRS